MEAALKMVAERSGRTFDPALVELFARRGRELLEALEPASLWDQVMDAEPAPRRHLAGEEIATACLAIADFAEKQETAIAQHRNTG